MEKKILQFIKENGLVGKRLVLAVSGGVDSVVLLDLFAKALPKTNLIVAHLNHAIRKESDGEEIFVRDLSQKYGIEFIAKKLELGKKNEEKARAQRYKFLRSVEERSGSSFIVLAHHLNDQAETILLNLTRGTGPIEVWGMQQKEDDLLRPLLSCPKDEILEYARKNNLKWVNDPSNEDIKFNRNLIRKKVIPELVKINPKFLQAIERSSKLGQEAGELLEGELKSAEKRTKNNSEISTTQLKKEKNFTQKEIIRRALWEMTGKKEGIYSVNVDKVQELIVKNGTKKSVIGQFTVEKIYDRIVFGSGRDKAKQKLNVDLAKRTKFNDFLLTTAVKEAVPKKNNILLPEELSYNLSVRNWQNGDKIKTASGTKKLQDLFTNEKIPRKERGSWPIIVRENEILWVPLLAASEKALNKKTKAFVIEVKNEK